MKRFFAIVLTLAMLIPMVLSVGNIADAADYTVKPYYGLGWSDINRVKFDNLEGLTIVSVKIASDGVRGLSYAGKSDPKEIAASVKKITDKLPEGMRQLFLAGTSKRVSLPESCPMRTSMRLLKRSFPPPSCCMPMRWTAWVS